MHTIIVSLVIIFIIIVGIRMIYKITKKTMEEMEKRHKEFEELKELMQNKTDKKQEPEEKIIGKDFHEVVQDKSDSKNILTYILKGKIKTENIYKFIYICFIIILIMLLSSSIYAVIKIIEVYKTDEVFTFHHYLRYLSIIISAVFFYVYIIRFLKKFNKKNIDNTLKSKPLNKKPDEKP